MRNLLIIFSIVSTMCITGCANWQPYTSAIEEKYAITLEERGQLQYKNSKEIVLKNQSDSLEKEIIDGELVIKNDSRAAEVIIPEKTNGAVIESSASGTINVSFSKNDECYLRFIEDSNGKFVLGQVSSGGKKSFVKYCGTSEEDKYTVTSGSNAYLLFSMKQLNKLKKTKKTEKGRKVK